MATNIPANLKAADLTRFIVRAAQLETAKPVVAYWCKLPCALNAAYMLMREGEYWIVNQILSRELHHGDDDTMKYTLSLMDKLEKVRR